MSPHLKLAYDFGVKLALQEAEYESIPQETSVEEDILAEAARATLARKTAVVDWAKDNFDPSSLNSAGGYGALGAGLGLAGTAGLAHLLSGGRSSRAVKKLVETALDRSKPAEKVDHATAMLTLLGVGATVPGAVVGSQYYKENEPLVNKLKRLTGLD